MIDLVNRLDELMRRGESSKICVFCYRDTTGNGVFVKNISDMKIIHAFRACDKCWDDNIPTVCLNATIIRPDEFEGWHSTPVCTLCDAKSKSEFLQVRRGRKFFFVHSDCWEYAWLENT